MPQPSQKVIDSPIGKLGIYCQDNQLIKIEFAADKIKDSASHDALFANIIKQLQHYFANPDYQFDLNFNIKGTEHQKKVWQALTKIPRGKAVTYGELAKRLKSSPRAIGGACRANPIPLIIPCHRVVAKKGLGGFAGDVSGRLIKIKYWLLQHEGYDSKII